MTETLRATGPVAAILLILVAVWYAGSVRMNAAWTERIAERDGIEHTTRSFLSDVWNQDRPVLPAPHQVAEEIWKTTAEVRPTSRRSLVHHGWITLEATLVGFALGTALGILLAVGIVHNRAMDASVMPWVIASQTIPILAIAPMVIVVLYSVGVQGLIAKATISAYLAFFPVVVGMVAGLRAPEVSQLDLMRTYNASRWQIFWKLRLPTSVPYLFTSLKIRMRAPRPEIAPVGNSPTMVPTSAAAIP
ncbi:MAG: ABC transporter permease subunit, partial [Pseudomonadota bacterium]